MWNFLRSSEFPLSLATLSSVIISSHHQSACRAEWFRLRPRPRWSAGWRKMTASWLHGEDCGPAGAASMWMVSGLVMAGGSGPVAIHLFVWCEMPHLCAALGLNFFSFYYSSVFETRPAAFADLSSTVSQLSVHVCIMHIANIGTRGTGSVVTRGTI